MTLQIKLQTEEYQQTELGELPKEWKVVRLGDYCKISSGYAFKSADFVKKGVFIVKIGNLQNGIVVKDKRTNYFPENKVLGNVKKFILKEGDILIAMTGATTGKVAVVPKEYENSLLNQRVGKFDIFSDDLDNSFFRFFSITKSFQEKVLDNILKSAQGNVSPKQIENINISFPPFPEQQRIAHVLLTIQELKEKTENFINTLEELKKSTMKHLFTYGYIKFDNVDKLELIETEIGELPKEWEIKKLGNINQEKCKNISPVKDETYEYYSIPAYQESQKPSIVEGKTILSQKKILKESMILFGKLNPRVEKVWIVKNYSSHKKIGSGEWITIISNPEEADSTYLYYLQWSHHVMPIAKTLVSGSTPSRQRVDPTSFYDLNVPLPSLDEQKNIASMLSVIDSKIGAEENKKKALEELFNSMLEDLMTAKIRVNNLEVVA